MKTLLTLLTLITISASVIAQNTIKLSDFESVNNTNWKGSLTYKDYQSGNQETIPSTMQLKIENDKLVMTIQYDYEPNKNNTSKVKIKKNGTYFGNEKVISFTEENGTKTLITVYKARDNGKKAKNFMIRVLTNDTYTVTKKVQYEGTEDQFIRNSYSYKKI